MLALLENDDNAIDVEDQVGGMDDEKVNRIYDNVIIILFNSNR